MGGYTGRATASGFAYGSGRYYIPQGIGATSAGSASTAGTLRFMPGIVQRSVKVSSLCVRISTAAAGGNFQLALYRADPATGLPTGAPLFTSASQSTTAAGIIEVTGVNLQLSAGLYWLAVMVDATGAATVFRAANTNEIAFMQVAGATSVADAITSSGSNELGAYTKPGVFGTWPALTGNFATDGLGETSGQPGAVWAFKVA